MAALMLALLFSVSAGAMPVGADGTTWYVDGVAGQDIGACGTTVTPCKTLSYTIDSQAGNDDTIRVAQGIYTENLTIDKTIALEGGYEAGGWTRDVSAHETVIDGSNSHTVWGDWDGWGIHQTTVISDTGVYKVWYRGWGLTGSGFGLATSIDGITWIKSPDNPLFTPTEDWEEGDVGHPHVIKDGATYKMWYGPNDDKIGYAWSSDGIAWTKYADNPILEGDPGTWNEDIGAPFVIKVGPNDYRMWYQSRSMQYAIGYATSTNGVDWIKRVAPVLTVGAAGSWDDEKVADPNVLFDGITYHMWYSGEDGDAIRIGYATSPDGIVWTKHASNPVLTRGAPGDWDGFGVGEGNVLYDGSQFRMWFTGWENTWANSQKGYATSPDGIVWTKYAGNPVLAPGASGAWGQPVARFRAGSGGSLLDGFTVRNGEAEYGGGVLIEDRVTVQSCLVISNTAHTHGGGISINEGASAVVRSNRILSNTTEGWIGAGISVIESEALIDRNQISWNTDEGAQWGVGTIGIHSPDTSQAVTMTNNLIVDNIGKGIQIGEGAHEVSIVNNTIAKNSAEGVMAWGTLTVALVRNNIIADNGGCALAGGPGATFELVDHNNIWQNGEDGTGDYCDYGGAVIPPAPGTGSLSTSPLFVDAANGDYHLRAGSPCVDRGSNVSAPTTDLDGLRRPSAVTDIGAYEFQWPRWYYLAVMTKIAIW